MFGLILHGIGLGGLTMMLIWIWAVFDCISTDSILVRNLPKTTWLCLVVFVPTVGAVAWLILGRPEHAGFSFGGQRSRFYRDDMPSRTFSAPAPRGIEDDPSWRATTTRSAPATDDEPLAIRERKLLEREAELAKREAELDDRSNESSGEDPDDRDD